MTTSTATTNSVSPAPRALVIGITGGIGGEVAQALLRRGWDVHALHRNPGSVALPPELQGRVRMIRGDAMSESDVVAAAVSIVPDVIVHAVNPPKYNNWRGLALPMLENTIAAARATSARIVFPGTIYNFGDDALPKLSETSPQHPRTRKGAIRVEMERRLEAAAADSVRVLVVRAGDFFGPHAGSNWFAQGLLAGRKSVSRVFYPGPGEIGHSWAYLPDLAETMARLLEPGRMLGKFEVFHFRGQWLPAGIEMARAVCSALGIPESRIGRFPWWAMSLAAPFVEVCREMLEMRYLWHTAVELDNSKLLATLGSEPHTPLRDAVVRTLTAAGVTAS